MKKLLTGFIESGNTPYTPKEELIQFEEKIERIDE